MACIELGFNNGLKTTNSEFGAVPSTFALDNVHCDGTETELIKCTHLTTDDCSSYEGAGVICYDSTVDDIEIRDGGSKATEAADETLSGNLFIKNSDGYVGPVCDFNWQNKEARVACKQLGYEDGRATINSNYGPVPPVFSMQGISCQGTESKLTDCSIIAAYDLSRYCRSQNVGAGVICSRKTNMLEIELQGGIFDQKASVSFGNLIVRNENDILGPVCDDRWTESGADAACKQLYFENAIHLVHSQFGPNSDDHSMLVGSCSSSATKLTTDENQCSITHFDSNTDFLNVIFYCGPEDIAGVYCFNKTTESSKK